MKLVHSTFYEQHAVPSTIGFGVWHLKHTLRFKKFLSLQDGQFLKATAWRQKMHQGAFRSKRKLTG